MLHFQKQSYNETVHNFEKQIRFLFEMPEYH